MIQRRVRFSDAQDYISEADVLLFRGTGLVSRLLRVASRSTYSHAAIATRNGSLSCLEVREWIGGRRTLLKHQVEKYPGAIDVYKPVICISHCKERRITTRAVDLARPDLYGWKAIKYCALSHLAFVRLLWQPNYEENPDIYPHCSALVSMAYREIGIDLVPNLPDYRTEPGDLARSGLLRYRFTLVSDTDDYDAKY
jgi:hypothetical protein